MDLFADGPAALGGILISVAIIGWTLGRWQGGFAAPEDARAPAGREKGAAGALPASLHPSPGVDAARAQRGAALAAADSLGELHAEISAYRRAEQVLVGPDADGLRLCPPGEAVRSVCRDPVEMGELTCGLSEAACDGCNCKPLCSLAYPLAQVPVRTEPLLQPSRPDLGLTRV